MATEVEKKAKQEIKSTAAEHLQDAGTAYTPEVDVYVNHDEMVFAVDMPGVEKGGVNIEINENNTLIIQANCPALKLSSFRDNPHVRIDHLAYPHPLVNDRSTVGQKKVVRLVKLLQYFNDEFSPVLPFSRFKIEAGRSRFQILRKRFLIDVHPDPCR